MRSFVDWADNLGFQIKDTWNDEKGISSGPGRMKLYPMQRRIFELALTPNEDGRLPYTTLLLGQTKKSGKTATGAAIMAWAAEEWEDGSEIFSTASSKEQSIGRAFGDVGFHVQRSERNALVKPTEDRITYPNGTVIQALAKNYKSAAGSRHALTHWDELWGFETERDLRMWDELTPIPTVKNSLQIITTYAGFEGESHLLWNLYLNGVGAEEHEDGKGTKIPGYEDLPLWENGRQLTLWDHQNRMPWQTDDYINQQLGRLRPSAFLRFHRNEWTSSDEAFIPSEWWDIACTHFEKSAWNWPEHPYRNYPVIMFVDAATKKDNLAIVGVSYDPTLSAVILMFHKIWEPAKSEAQFDFEDEIEPYIIEAAAKFNVIACHYDPRDLHQTSIRLAKQGINMVEFKQTPSNIADASQALYDILVTRSLYAYPDPVARQQVITTVAKNTERGFQITKKNQRGETPNDFTVALAGAIYNVLKEVAPVDEQIIRVQTPFHDFAEWDPATLKDPPGMPPELVS